MDNLRSRSLPQHRHSIYSKEKLWFFGGTGFCPHAVLLRKNEILSLIGQWDQAEEITRECLRRAESSDDRLALSECILGRAALLYIQGHYPETLELYQRVQTLYAETGQGERRDRMQLSLGSLYVRMARFDQARECYQQALASAPGDIRLVMGVRLNLGLLHIQLEEFPGPYRECRRALELARQLGDPKEVYKVRINLGIAARETGRLDEAMECAEHTIAFAQKIHEKRGCGMGYNNAALIWQKRGNLELAVEYFKRYLVLAESMKDMNNQAIASNNLAGALLEKGELAEAGKYFSLAHDIMKSFENRLYQADSLYNLARVRRAANDLPGARDFLNQALEIAESIPGNPYMEKYLNLREELTKIS